MKKTLTVNLGGTVFHIDEDAYQLLDKYLSNLRIHFRKEEGSDEIMDDFEMRISELLNERVRLGYEVITIEQVENIGKTVTDGFEKVSNNVNDFISSDKPRNFFQKLADVFVLVIGFILKFFIILAGIFLLPPLVLVVFILVVVTFALLMGGAGFIYNLSPFGADLINGAPLSMAIMGCIGTILFIGIPIFSLIYAICCQLFKVRPLPTQARWILLALWLISLVLCGVYIHQSGMLYDWHDYWNGVHGWNRHAVWLP